MGISTWYRALQELLQNPDQTATLIARGDIHGFAPECLNRFNAEEAVRGRSVRAMRHLHRAALARLDRPPTVPEALAVLIYFIQPQSMSAGVDTVSKAYGLTDEKIRELQFLSASLVPALELLADNAEVPAGSRLVFANEYSVSMRIVALAVLLSDSAQPRSEEELDFLIDELTSLSLGERPTV